MKLGFIGVGTVGVALARKLSDAGYPVTAVSSKNGDSARKLAGTIDGCRPVNNQGVADAAELVLIATPDDAIAEVARGVGWHRGQGVVHLSGADSVDILQPAREDGASVGAFHPLQTFASVAQAIENIPGSTFALEAEEPLLATLKEMAEAVGGHWIELEASDKTIYHAAAVMACNYLVTLMKLSTDLWDKFGVPRQEAVRALLPLVRGTLHNIETVGIPGCLTGPIARGDTGTVSKHIQALRKSAPELLDAYRELGLQTVPIALAKGKIDNGRAEELKELLRKPAGKNINTERSR